MAPRELGELLDVVLPAPIREIERVELGQRGDLRRQLGSGRHRRTLDQDRDHCHVRTVERCVYLLLDQVVVSVDSPGSAGSFDSQPTRADEDERELTRIQRLADLLLKISPWSDCVDVDEDIRATELVDQRVREPTGVTARIGSPIGDEDARDRPSPNSAPRAPILAPYGRGNPRGRSFVT